ncbi:hypothetical protein [Luteipulveratus mongoliensis]|uniref:PKD domain-containing protein n=1 Tax=Luteipulveratus mongoliensis TaxID=571913 RepID=A0A0K1JNK9_9MICO|nr:hypothetical protein [Luteipulveratus mongoliensis]AKU18286.1 hypothetical protein VV02_24640 [Luteipulveratus mongoliensis]
MSLDLEQRLRDALEARAAQVTPDDLDIEREHELRRVLVGQPATQPGRWRPVLAIGGGLAAAALIVGTIATVASNDGPSSVAADPTLSTTSATAAPSDSAGTPDAPTSDVEPPATEEVPRRTTAASPSRGSATSRDTFGAYPSVPSSSSTLSTPTGSTTSAPVGNAKVSIYGAAGAQGNDVSVTYGISGRVHAFVEGGDAQPTFTQVTYGDGQQDGSDGGGVTCDPAGALRPINMKFGPLTHTYAKPGTYTVTFIIGYCGDKGATTATTTKTVTVAAAS